MATKRFLRRAVKDDKKKAADSVNYSGLPVIRHSDLPAHFFVDDNRYIRERNEDGVPGVPIGKLPSTDSYHQPGQWYIRAWSMKPEPDSESESEPPVDKANKSESGSRAKSTCDDNYCDLFGSDSDSE